MKIEATSISETEAKHLKQTMPVRIPVRYNFYDTCKTILPISSNYIIVS